MIWGKWSNKWNNSPLQMYHITPTFYALIGNILCALAAELNIRAVLQRAVRDKNTYVMQVRTALITVGRLWTPTVICLTARRSFLLWGNYILVTIDIAVIPQNTVTYAPIPASLFTRAESLNGTYEDHCTTIRSLGCASYDVHLFQVVLLRFCDFYCQLHHTILICFYLLFLLLLLLLFFLAFDGGFFYAAHCRSRSHCVRSCSMWPSPRNSGVEDTHWQGGERAVWLAAPHSHDADGDSPIMFMLYLNMP